MSIKAVWKQNRLFITIIFLLFVFRSSFADWNLVPTGSMKPTIIEGDRILVNKLAYDLNIPFTHISLKKFADPVRGDIIIFDSDAAGKRLVKRVIGIPGDTIEMVNNSLIINNKAVKYSVSFSNQFLYQMEEDLAGITNPLLEQHSAKHNIQFVYPFNSSYSSFRKRTIPDGYYFVLGDNRNNSADSRIIGLVPRSEIVGKSSLVIMSHDFDNYYIPRKSRLLEKI